MHPDLKFYSLFIFQNKMRFLLLQGRTPKIAQKHSIFHASFFRNFLLPCLGRETLFKQGHRRKYTTPMHVNG